MMTYAKRRVVLHKSIVRKGPFGGTLTTTLCGRMQTGSDGMNIGEGVTCKFCLRKLGEKACVSKIVERETKRVKP
jgi:hypothetical protein